jgi:Flp pilus assembly protein TadD
MNSKVIRFAASGIVLGATMVGCKPAAQQYRPVSLSAKEQRADQQANKFYQSAQQLLQKGELQAALGAMENAVALSPRDAGYRMGLAELYMKSGRFQSAETTLNDVLVLNPENARAGISLALAQMAQGRQQDALAQLSAMEGKATASDLGLAYALAGEAGRAVAILEPAAREPGATGRVRQNLALAYAFAGDWKKARVTAAQDVSPARIDARLAQWAAMADPSATPMRVANMMGVTPAQDAGQPTRLALAPVAPAGEAYADAALPPEAAPPAIAAAPPIVTALAQPVAPESAVAASFAPAPATWSANAEEAADVIVDESAPLAEESPVVQAEFAAAAQTLVETAAIEPEERDSRLASIRAYVAQRYDAPKLETSRRPTGRYVVQLGAFSTPANVERAWAKAMQHYGRVLANEPLSTTIQLGGKRTLYRLSMAGFGSQNAAQRACETIRSRGGACFVRTIAGDAPVQWASRYARKA